MTTIQARCPACGEAKLTVTSDGRLRCAHVDCPQPGSLSKLLNEPFPAEHWVHLRPTGFYVMHPLIERVDQTIFDCEIDTELAIMNAPPHPLGTYIVRRPPNVPRDAGLIALAWEKVA